MKALGSVCQKQMLIIHMNFYFTCQQQRRVALHVIHERVLYARFYGIYYIFGVMSVCLCVCSL